MLFVFYCYQYVFFYVSMFSSYLLFTSSYWKLHHIYVWLSMNQMKILALSYFILKLSRCSLGTGISVKWDVSLWSVLQCSAEICLLYRINPSILKIILFSFWIKFFWEVCNIWLGFNWNLRLKNYLCKEFIYNTSFPLSLTTFIFKVDLLSFLCLGKWTWDVLILLHHYDFLPTSNFTVTQAPAHENH